MTDYREGLVGLPASVLVVDDEPLIRRGYAMRLRDVGMAAVEAASVDEALAHMAALPIEVIVADVNMPGRSGLALLSEVRGTYPDVPVILMTADPTLESALSALDHGVFGYVPKPVEAGRLRSLVTRAVAIARLNRARHAAYQLLSNPATPSATDVTTFNRALLSLYPVFQPIVRWPEGQVVAYEALLRVTEPPDFGPAEVLELAERIGGIHRLGREIRASVARCIAHFAPDVRVFVNVHSEELLDAELYSKHAPLSAFAARVTLELTERVALTRVDDVAGQLRRLRALGYRIAVDDLGAGYSSLANLIALEPDVVKLDLQLIRGIDQHPARRNLVGALTHLSRQLNIELIAEGVETQTERDTLQEIGVELMQGFYFGRPGPINEPSTAEPLP